MQGDDYLTIAAPAEGLYREKGSKFIAYAYPFPHEDGLKTILESLRKQHPKSRHFCFAYRIGMDGNRFRANDDGEPSGSAGQPILGQIDSQGLTNVLVVVVRYFGGTKLGIPGLIRAYKTSTAEALAQADIVTRTQEDLFRISFGYADMGDVMAALKQAQTHILEKEFGEKPYLIIGIPKSEVADSLLRLRAMILKISVEEAAGRDWERVQVKPFPET